MKKLLLFSLTFVLFSCTSNNKKIELVKKDLLSKNVSAEELKGFRFDEVEILGKDAYKVIFEKLAKEHKDYSELGNLESATSVMKKIDTISEGLKKIKTKKYTRVHAYRIAGDTVANSYYYITDTNTIYGIK